MSGARRAARSLAELFSSYGLACIVMMLMIVLTILGTLDQAKYGLYEVQRRYFASFFFLYRAPGGIPLPLPGAYLLMAILSVNLLLGGIVRGRWRWNNFGLIIVHCGILFLLLSALITHHFGVEGQMTLAPNETSDQFQSYYDWDLTIVDGRDDARDVLYRIPASRFAGADYGDARKFTSAQLPFDIVVDAYFRNCQAAQKGPMFTAPTPVVDGFFLQPLMLDKENEFNFAGAYVTLRDKATGEARPFILWGREPKPLVLVLQGKTWRLDLERRKWTVPFSITLKHFTREFHPGTSIPEVYMSDIVKTENGHAQDIAIRMNEPLRHEGYTFFQSGFHEDPATGVLSSTFAVVRNPADQFPLYALIAIGFGMLVHFTMRLTRYLRENRNRNVEKTA